MEREVKRFFLFLNGLVINPSPPPTASDRRWSTTLNNSYISRLLFELAGLTLIGITLTPDTLWAATINAASCSQAAVQTAISSASTGDTVLIPAGSCAWSSGVSINGITLQGSGGGRIIAYSEPTQTIGTGSKTVTVTLTAGATAPSAGQTLRVSQLGARGNYMEGTVTSYSAPTLVMNITSTAGSGSATRWLVSTVPSTVLTDNVSAGATMINMIENTTARTEFRDIKIGAGTGTGFVLQFLYTSSGQAMLVHNCWIESGSVSGELIRSNTNRGLVHHCSFDSSPYAMSNLAIVIKDSTNGTGSWSASSTMGTADTTGAGNLYVEDSDFHAFLNAFDNDDNGRMVVRYSTLNHAAFGTHGADSSPIGQRHFEVYQSTFIRNTYSNGSTLNLPRWFYIRGGTFAIHDNTFSTAPGGNDYPAPILDMTEQALQRNTGAYYWDCWGMNIAGVQYPAPRQVGFGNVSNAAGTGSDGLYKGDSEPAYIWNNTNLSVIGTSNYGSGFPDSCVGTTDSAADYIVAGRDYFLSAKPGYAVYTYPHPLVNGATINGATPPPPPSPQGLVVTNATN